MYLKLGDSGNLIIGQHFDDDGGDGACVGVRTGFTGGPCSLLIEHEPLF
jgi:hypothetical protein